MNCGLVAKQIYYELDCKPLRLGFVVRVIKIQRSFISMELFSFISHASLHQLAIPL